MRDTGIKNKLTSAEVHEYDTLMMCPYLGLESFKRLMFLKTKERGGTFAPDMKNCINKLKTW